MPTREDVERIKALLTSPEEVAYFYDTLTSPDWLPLLRDGGLVGVPPAPIEHGNGVMFPFWPVSRYLVRIAGDAPEAVAEALWSVSDTRNPRVWWDTVDALVKMPPAHAIRFAPLIKRWVHHPLRVGVGPSVARLVTRLIDEGARDPAVDLARSLACLVTPDDWPDGEPWLVLDDHDYGVEVPPIGRALAAFGSLGPRVLVEELERFLAVERAPGEDGRHADLSFIWRPAIEDHEQNSDYHREAKLVIAIRDGFEEVVARAPGELETVVTTLVASEWPVVRRVGLHLLVGAGDRATDLVERAVTDGELLGDAHHRHELYRLVSTRFGALSPGAMHRFVEAVRSVADAAAVSAATREPSADPDVARNLVLRRWLGAASGHLDEEGRAELAAAEANTGLDAHPDFPAYHTSWRGSSSPVSSQELAGLDPDRVIELLATWKEAAGFGPHDSVEGLAQQLADAVVGDPTRFAPSAARYLSLDPAYFNGLVNGLQKALELDRGFDWEPVLRSCGPAIAKAGGGSGDDPDATWETVRISVGRLLGRGLARSADGIPFELRDVVWPVIARLAEDRDPTPADEARFGSPNMDPETYSLNTTRGVAMHAVLLYVLWVHRQEGSPETWSIDDQAAEASAVLDAHLDPLRDPSAAIRAAYGWWLPQMLDRDPGWVRGRADRLVGRVETSLERAAWEAFLFRSRGGVAALEVFAGAYAGYADQLAARDSKPDESGRHSDPVEFFVDHLVLAWLWNPAMRGTLPLRTLLASGQAWLAAAVVEESGQLIGRSAAKDLPAELDAAYRDLWAFVLAATANLDEDDLKEALAPFAWWFGSGLSGDWTLSELLRLIDRGISPEPDFVVLPRLRDLTTGHPEETLRVIEHLAASGDERWTLRVHEGEVREVLAASLQSTDGLLQARAEVAVHRLGRLGLGGLASLLGWVRGEHGGAAG